MTFDEFLERIEGVHTGGNGFVGVCPAHEDKEASLGITEGDDGRVLLNCYAGCMVKDVVEAMGLRMRDLFPTSYSNDTEPDAIYPYHDENGTVLFEAVRMPGKRFRQRHVNEEGEVQWDLDGVRRVPFRLPELRAAVSEGHTIVLVEGEKDALRFSQETGVFATCNPMGAGKWRPEYTGHFIGAKSVIIIQDRDDPGRRHAEKIKEALTSVGVPVQVLQAKQGKDASDHFDAGFTLADFMRPRKTPKRGIITITEMVEAGLEHLQFRPSDLPGYELVKGVEGSVMRQGRLYAGGAYTGDGKTTIALQGTRAICEQGVKVGYFTMEMSEADLRNRLISHKGVPLRLLEQPWLLKQDPEMLALYHLALEEMRDWRLEIIYDTHLKVERLVEEVFDREYEFVVLDHIHRLGFGDRRNFEEQIKTLTNVTLDANIPMLVLCQLRRYQRGKDMVSYPPPVLQDFRETEVLGNEASIAFAIWRQRDQEGLQYQGDASQYRVLKNRHTTSTKDQAGHIELLNFDRSTQLYSTGGVYSAPIDERLPTMGGPDVWEDLSDEGWD
jgi:5S rRNA maturation endonuclease (ribonuclease M5)/KaiC/GvpD/RAD55 family RecA-like ATPase